MVQASRRKFHYIYKITRIDTGKYYIGMHSTDDLGDGYFGSGKLITASVKKHGKEKHIKEILEYCDSRELLKIREKELIGELYHLDESCLNLQPGGSGGFKDDEHQAKCTSAASNVRRGSILPETHRQAIRLSMIGNSNFERSKGFAGHLHTEETKQKMRKTKNAGEANSQFGTCWVIRDTPIKIRKNQLCEFLENGFRRGRT